MDKDRESNITTRWKSWSPRGLEMQMTTTTVVLSMTTAVAATMERVGQFKSPGTTRCLDVLMKWLDSRKGNDPPRRATTRTPATP